MSIELSAYFQQSLSKHQEIDRRLQPLLNIIKENKINSVHQLSNDLAYQQSPIDQHVLSSIHKRQLKKTNLHKFYSQQEKHSLEKRKISIENTRSTIRKYESKSANQSRNVPTSQIEQPRVYRSANIKVKKHLVDSLRFQSLQTFINEKVRKTNPYKNFIENLERKKNSESGQKRKHVSLYKLEKVRLIDNEQAIQIFEKCNNTNQDNLFKVKIRKRFWKKQRPTSKQKANLSTELCVKGMKGMAMTIQ